MDDGVVSSNNAGETYSSAVVTVTEEFSTISIGGGNGNESEVEVEVERPEKDPRTMARKYQMDLCQKALNENTIAYLGTGCGKTHIAVLLMYEMRHLIKKPQLSICVFLAPTVALVEQQAKVIEDSIDFKVGIYCGSSKRLKGHHDWEKEMAQYEVFVMTPQILLHNLSHCFIRIERIALLIFDECHYAQVESNHPYAEIMKVFYKSNTTKLPRIFGMTASPKLGKGASINSLEALLHAKVYSVEDKEELKQFVTSPKVIIYYYTTPVSSTSCHSVTYLVELENIKHQCVLILSKNTKDRRSSISTKKNLQRLHDSLSFCLEKLGLWAARQATDILRKGDHSERNEVTEVDEQSTDDSLCDRYLSLADRVFAAGCMKDGSQADLILMDVLTEPFYSRKLLRLIDILSNFRLQTNMKCIIFVSRILTARSLASVLQKLSILSSWKCDFLVGVHSGLKSVSRKTTQIMLEKFRSGELNLLVATKVGEEGLDIQTCCLVIRFDLPETVASFIQSRGRARMPQSEYAFLVDSGNQKELNLIQSFKKGEDQMNEEINCRTTTATFEDLEEKIYKVDSTGATISSGSSISLLHRYCSKLPHDEFFKPKPEFYYFDDVEGTICQITLPSNAPIHEITSSPQSSLEAAKKDACLQACKELHQLGALTNYLLPEPDDENEDSMQYSSDSDCSDDEDSRVELHEMLVPAALKEPWSDMDNIVHLSSYYIKFIPQPPDREYKSFGLFLKVPLPREVDRMKLDLCLARGRSVMTELVPSAIMRFDKDEIVLAQKFQEMFLKIIIDRSDFIPEFVPLGENGYGDLRSITLYLMLPVIWHECSDTMTVDWQLIRRCLSSPIFRKPQDAVPNDLPHPRNQLYLANGLTSTDKVVNSLVYAPSKDIFFFISDVIPEKNAYSIYKESRNYAEHYEMVGIRLVHPSQPLLKAKQLFCLDNLLRKKGNSESRHKEEHFIELPPEICQLKIIGFSKDIGSSLSLLPSIMHRLESLLVAFELKNKLAASFPEGSDVTTSRILEALTTERCCECLSLERLEVLGDAFLKFSVGRSLFLLYDSLDEGQLTRKRSNSVKNSNLCKLATAKGLQVYIRDYSFEPSQFFVLGRPCSVICSTETEKSVHSLHDSRLTGSANIEVKCNRSHHWLRKKTIADVVEAIVGVFIVDSGFKAAAAFLSWIGIQVGFEVSRVSSICLASSIYMPLAAQIDIAALESLLEYEFVHKGLLVQAFVHPSYNSQCGGCYQRLEFLGDAVMDYLITSYLYSMYPSLKPGQLTDLRSMSVNNNLFAGIAISKSFHNFLLSDSNALRKSVDKYIDFTRKSVLDQNQVEAPSCPKALGDLVESCIGAILLDTGFDLNRVWKTMLSFLDPVMSFSKLQLNPIRELQELCQSHNWVLEFVSSKKDKVFLVEAKVNGGNVSGCSINHSKKAAKKEVAKQVILMLKEKGYKPKHKSLEDIVKQVSKKAPKLIGYDETPSNGIAPDAAELDNMKVQESSRGNGSSKVHPVTVEPTKHSDSRVKPTRESPSLCTSQDRQPTDTVKIYSDDAEPQTAGGSIKKTAKSRLYEICSANCWKPPIFECIKEMGLSHLKEFTFKVILEIDDVEHCIVEVIGGPRAKKKDAAEHAAEGALWYLERTDHIV